MYCPVSPWRVTFRASQFSARSSELTRYVIVGAGAAGISAAEAIRGRDHDGEIILVSVEKAGYYSRPGLAYYLTKELTERSLYPFSKEDFNHLGVKWVRGRVMRLNPTEKTVEFSNGKMLRYDKVLLAVGAAARKPQMEGIDLQGVVYLDSMATAQEMIKQARIGKSAVVLGGGITALEIVEGLNARGVKVNFFLRGSHYWGRVLDKTESIIVLNRLRHEGINVHSNTEAEKIIGKNGKVRGVLTKDGRQIRCRMVGIAIGVGPRLQIAKASGLEVGRGIYTDEYLETSQPDIYAAGDAAEVFEPNLGMRVVNSLWGLAKEQGHVAGLNMAGAQQVYRQQSPLNVTRLAGLTTTIIGTVGSADNGEDDYAIVRGESENWQKIPGAMVYQNDFEVNRVRIMVGENELVGAVVMGDQTLSRPLEDLVRERVDISAIRHLLIQPNFNAGETIINFWERWRDENSH